MDKYIEGMDDAAVRKVFEHMEAAGIGVHVNLIGGFPGDTLADSEGSVDFLMRALADLSGATYILNAFALFPDTPILADPGRFRITPVVPPGDMPSSYPFTPDPGIEADAVAVYEAIPRLLDKLNIGLGWDRYGDGDGARTALALYFGFGHGSLFKARPDNPFANPLRGPFANPLRGATP